MFKVAFGNFMTVLLGSITKSASFVKRMGKTVVLFTPAGNISEQLGKEIATFTMV